MATANFVAVTQFVSASQLRVDWKLLADADVTQVLPFIGFVGMVWMISSIPILIGCALYHELTLRCRVRTRETEKTPAFFWILWVSIMGIPLTLVAFHPVFGISFFLAFVFSAIGAALAVKRFYRSDPRV
jgi:hypothetical protein